MNVLAICGGLRDESNTNKLVRAIAESSRCECEIVEMSKIEVRPCTGCGECMMYEGKCPIEDDMQDLYEKLITTDAIVLGSPTYYMNISGAVKCFVDRSLALYYRGMGPVYDPDMPFMGQRPLAGKPGVLVTTVAGGGHEKAMEALSLCMAESHRLNIVEKMAEVVGMNDVHDMPEVMGRAEEAGKKLGDSLKQG